MVQVQLIGLINSMVIRECWKFQPRGGRCFYKPLINQFLSKSVDELVRYSCIFPVGFFSHRKHLSEPKCVTKSHVRPFIQLIGQEGPICPYIKKTMY